ncbi:MAG: PP2C family serine/threonine-protein phosphatase [Mariniblastus sp.]
MSIQIDVHGESHVGRHRPDNEDQFLIADLNKSMRVHQTSLGLSHQTRLFGGSQGKLLLVADGLGGHESGERASTLAVDGVANYILNTMDWFFRVNEKNEVEFESELKDAFRHSQSILDAESEAIPQRRGMATTLTLAYIDWPKLYVVHVGDTRCYHIRGEAINCRTTDHTIAELTKSTIGGSEKDSKSLDEGDTKPHNPMGHALWNVIGGSDRSLDPQITKSELVLGDSLLLCSDGLTRYVPDKELLSLVSQDVPSKEICDQLIAMANERGGRDNITSVLAKFNENQLDDAEAAAVTATIPCETPTASPVAGIANETESAPANHLAN